MARKKKSLSSQYQKDARKIVKYSFRAAIIIDAIVVIFAMTAFCGNRFGFWGVFPGIPLASIISFIIAIILFSQASYFEAQEEKSSTIHKAIGLIFIAIFLGSIIWFFFSVPLSGFSASIFGPGIII